MFQVRQDGKCCLEAHAFEHMDSQVVPSLVVGEPLGCGFFPSGLLSAFLANRDVSSSLMHLLLQSQAVAWPCLPRHQECMLKLWAKIRIFPFKLLLSAHLVMVIRKAHRIGIEVWVWGHCYYYLTTWFIGLWDWAMGGMWNSGLELSYTAVSRT